jgi:tetratricopeptide (TPR) repeat protein
VADLAKVVDTVTDRVECLQRLEEIAIQTGDEQRATEALHKIVNAGCSDDLECVQRLSWAAHEEQLRGNTGRALALYKRAYERASEDDGILETIAGLAVKAGLHGEAARDYERLAQRHPEQTGWMRAAQAERDEVVRSTMKL